MLDTHKLFSGLLLGDTNLWIVIHIYIEFQISFPVNLSPGDVILYQKYLFTPKHLLHTGTSHIKYV
jgi:hypothetical protein